MNTDTRFYKFVALITGALALVFALSTTFLTKLFLNVGFIVGVLEFAYNLVPVLVTIAGAALLVSYASERTFKSKWSFVFMSVVYILAVQEIGSIFSLIRSDFELLVFLRLIIHMASLALLFVGALRDRLKMCLIIGLGLVVISRILCIFDSIEMSLVTVLIEVLVPVFLGIICLDAIPAATRKLRTATVILAAIAFCITEQYMFYLSMIVLAYLFVPARVKVNLDFIAGVAFVLFALAELLYVISLNNLPEIALYLICLAAPVCLASAFLFQKRPMLLMTGFALIIVGVLINTFKGYGLDAFYFLSELVTIDFVAIIISAVLLMVVVANPSAKNPRRRTISVILSAVSLMFASIFISAYIYSYSPAVFNLFAGVCLIIAAFALVPFEFTPYQPMAKHIFLSIFTLGVWNMIWIYNVTKNLNCASETAKRSPVKELLLCIFLPLYTVYWNYKTSLITDKLASSRGVSGEQSVLVLVLSIVSPVLASVIIQNKINDIQ